MRIIRVKVGIPKGLSSNAMKCKMWEEYDIDVLIVDDLSGTAQRGA